MLLKAILLSVMLNYMVSAYPLKLDETASDDTWPDLDEGMPTYMGKSSTKTDFIIPCPPLKLPESQRINASDVHKQLFKPARNSRPVSDLMKSILLPQLLPVTQGPPKQPNIEILCHIDRIYVKVLRSLFISPNAVNYLKVGTCTVNKVTPEHYYFLYPINSCNVQRREDENQVLYSNMLSYDPVPSEPVIRELAFSVPLECRYHKHFRSYSIGYRPQVEVGTVFLRLQAGVSITPVDAQWEPLGRFQNYSIGQPMYFEAKAPYNQDGKRLYFNKCYITLSHYHDTSVKYTVVDNYGCMVDSKNNSQSKFHPIGEKTTLRLTVGALIFKDLLTESENEMEMFIHCEMALGPETPTPSMKSCSYNAETQRWSELFGDASVCACCNATCPAPDPSVSMKISSNPWFVEKSSPEQPAARSVEIEEEAWRHSGFEMFWDYFDTIPNLHDKA